MTVDSLLDTDLYKLTMQACVYKHYRDANVEYKLKNRNQDMQLSDEAVEWVRERVMSWSSLKLSEDEMAFLKKELSYLSDEYFDFISDFKLDPKNEVSIDYKGGADLTIKVRGAWHTTIWYEVPILATVSEAYFKFVDKDWDLTGQKELALCKAKSLIEENCPFSEFGTRRRRSREVQSMVAETLAENFKGNPKFFGTSNVYFAKKFGLKPIGTVAHELIMGVAAYTNDFAHANYNAMHSWIDTVGSDHAGVVLTDTFGTPLFFNEFKQPYIDWYAGVRHDSGDPELFTRRVSEFYKKAGIPPNTKKIVYSDALTVEKCIKLRDVAYKYNLQPAFGIGTYFTNDFKRVSDPSQKSKPLNIVMKISKVNGHPTVKLSDNIGKNTGDPAEVERIKKLLLYTDLMEEIDEAKRWVA